MWSKIPSFLKNKYALVLIIFGIWMLIFDRNSLWNRYKLNRTINRFQYEQAFYLKEIKQDSIALHELSSDSENLIRFAREKHLMKAENEDIYLIIED